MTSGLTQKSPTGNIQLDITSSVPPARPVFTDRGASYGKSGSLLLVDDEPAVLALERAMLESQGFAVTTAENGLQAMQILQESVNAGRNFNALLIDLTMPGGISGFELLEQVRGVDDTVPVIACSGYFQEDARELCRAIGFADILHKPFALEQLSTVIRQQMPYDFSQKASF
jgi:CheY-like chemotaxis protein